MFIFNLHDIISNFNRKQNQKCQQIHGHRLCSYWVLGTGYWVLDYIPKVYKVKKYHDGQVI